MVLMGTTSTATTKATKKGESADEFPDGTNSDEDSLVEEPLKYSFPFDDLEESELEGTVKATTKAVTGVLDEHIVRFTVPVDKMASIAEGLQKKLRDRKIEGRKGMRPLLEANLDEALEEISERDVQMNKSIFRQEMAKYTLIASSQLRQLSTTTMLSMVNDLLAGNANLTDYEAGCPPKFASSLYKFYDITEHEFSSLSEQQRLKLRIEYTKARLRHQEEMENWLEGKHGSLKAMAKAMPKGDPKDPFKKWPEGLKREEELAEAFKRNQTMGRLLKIEYERLKKQEEEEIVPYRDRFRTRALKGEIGARSEEKEASLDANFANTPLDVIKMLLDQVSADTCNGEEDDTSSVVAVPEKEAELDDQLEDEQLIAPTPLIHLIHDNM